MPRLLQVVTEWNVTSTVHASRLQQTDNALSSNETDFARKSAQWIELLLLNHDHAEETVRGDEGLRGKLATARQVRAHAV